MLFQSLTSLIFCYFITKASCQDDIRFENPFFDTIGRKYSCPGEIVTYVCSGIGNEIDIFAPPYINNTARLTFSRTDLVGTGSGTGAIGAFLFSAETDGFMSVGVVVRDYDLGQCKISCEIHSSTGTRQANITHIPSETPLKVNSPNIEFVGTLNNPDLSAVNVSWIANPGNYDFKRYTVTVYSPDDINNKMISINISQESNTVSVVLPVPKNIPIRAKITTVSHCLHENNDTAITMTILSLNNSGMALHYMTTVLVSVVAVSLLATFSEFY